jgi:hypothetical protein
MKTVLVTILLFVVVKISQAQYYYNDIITTQQTNQQYVLLKNNHVRQLSAKSYEADGETTENFALEQEVSGNGSEITTTSEFPSTGKSLSTSVYTNNKLTKTITNNDNVTSTVSYTYKNEHLESITTQTEDTFMNSSSQEVHQWFYENDQPVKMLLIKNNKDTTVIEFTKDEHGDIGEEHWKKNGRQVENYFYYYNDQHKLTDIVRFNAKAQRLLPDYLFEYDNNGILTQLTQIPQGSSDYLVWHYVYGANGLKQKELCFNKQKQPVGRIEYTYY